MSQNCDVRYFYPTDQTEGNVFCSSVCLVPKKLSRRSPHCTILRRNFAINPDLSETRALAKIRRCVRSYLFSRKLRYRVVGSPPTLGFLHSVMKVKYSSPIFFTSNLPAAVPTSLSFSSSVRLAIVAPQARARRLLSVLRSLWYKLKLISKCRC